MTEIPSTDTPKGPLKGLRIVDLSRLAPGPYCTMLLADLGAEVIVVGGGRAGVPIPELSRGKRFVSLDLKAPEGRAALHALVRTADVLVEGFRPGVADRIGAGYDELAALNPKLVYCSVTGFGQDGPRALEAGHDITYLALSGVLGGLGPKAAPPVPPLNLVADFAGGSLMAAIGILAAVLEARASGRGQKIDAAMVDGALSLMAMHLPLWHTPHWPARGEGLLAGDKPFYRTYACADGRFIAVGALERGFFETLWRTLDLGEAPDHMAAANWPTIERTLTDTFRARPRDAWAALFAGTDACVAPVLEPHEVWDEPHIAARHPEAGPHRVPAVPRLSRTPAVAHPLDETDQTRAILTALGFPEADMDKAIAPEDPAARSGLNWPPPLR
ncbi:CaiB/BaiF CoA transferase family protein [Xanthobacter agilis]|uniref:Alpha-methylacyl-CoA racemase n=1 Tax=Xanthobacter agilis TaxID=47492 RepID=A0ABU0LE89_XANAG|nr:CaiB/BaiF CoA-transferase family protein [Xanthobacter agilis]MDQ0505412.1 alpha-methylacyl-CoA racemase [Xanthobacter agilis]